MSLSKSHKSRHLTIHLQVPYSPLIIMKELFRDTVIGHFIRWLTRGEWLPHAEDLDPSLWRMYISTEKSSHFSNIGTLEPFKKPRNISTDHSYNVTPQSEKTEQSHSTGACDVMSNEAAPTAENPKLSNTRQIKGDGLFSRGTSKDGDRVPPTTTKPSQSESHEQRYVGDAIGQEGMDVSMKEGQVDGDSALQLQSSNSEAAWDDVQLETGREGVAPQDNSTKDRVVNVVVWFGPDDPEVSKQVIFMRL